MAKKRVAKKSVAKSKAAKKKAVKKVARAAPKRAVKKKAVAKKKVAATPALQVVSPYLCCKGAAAALDFYAKAFGAKERMRLSTPDGTIGHADILINGASIMLSDEWPSSGVSAPSPTSGSPVAIHVYVPDVDKLYARAMAAGATALGKLEDMPYGDRQVTLQDPFGHRWMFATKKEEVGGAELEKRMGGAFKVTY